MKKAAAFFARKAKLDSLFSRRTEASGRWRSAAKGWAYPGQAFKLGIVTGEAHRRCRRGTSDQNPCELRRQRSIIWRSPSPMANNNVMRSMSRSGEIWDNAVMESSFSSPKTRRIRKKVYRIRDETRADVFDYVERFYIPDRYYSTSGYLSPVEFEKMASKTSHAEPFTLHSSRSSSAFNYPHLRTGLP